MAATTAAAKRMAKPVLMHPQSKPFSSSNFDPQLGHIELTWSERSFPQSLHLTSPMSSLNKNLILYQPLTVKIRLKKSVRVTYIRSRY